MKLKELVIRNRSYRRFDPHVCISRAELLEWVNLARLSASSRNMQPLKYLLVNTPSYCEKVFACLSWAGYLPEWSPMKEEAPTAYVVLLEDKRITVAKSQHDEGIACQSILLGAVESGYGGCIIASVDREKLIREFNLASYLNIALVIALGKPIEDVQLCDVHDGDIRYYRDAQQHHFVPKRSLDEIVIEIGEEDKKG